MLRQFHNVITLLMHSLWKGIIVTLTALKGTLRNPTRKPNLTSAFLPTWSGRNHMFARYQAAQSATQTPVLSGNTWRLCMAPRHMLPRSSVEIFIPGLHHQETQAVILNPDHQASRLRVQLASKRTSATLPQSGKNASKWKLSSQKNQWYATYCASLFLPLYYHYLLINSSALLVFLQNHIF